MVGITLAYAGLVGLRATADKMPPLALQMIAIWDSRLPEISKLIKVGRQGSDIYENLDGVGT